MDGLTAAAGANEHDIPLVATIADYMDHTGLRKFRHFVRVGGDERCRQDMPS